MLKPPTSITLIVVNSWLCYVQTDPSRPRIPAGLECVVDRDQQLVWAPRLSQSGACTDQIGDWFVPKLGTKKHRGFSQHKRGRYMKNLSNEAGLVILILVEFAPRITRV